MPRPDFNAPIGHQDVRFKAFFIVLIAIILATLLGYWLPQADYMTALLVTTIVGGLLYTFALSQYAFYFAFLALALDFQLRPFSFAMSTSMVIGALFAPVFLLSAWRKDIPPSPTLLRWSREYLFLVFIVGAYLGVHFWYTWKNPVLPFSFGNVGKSYYSLFFPFLLIFLFLIKPPSIKLPRDPLKLISYTLLVGLLFNVPVTIYGTYFMGFGTSEFEGDEFMKTILRIPFLNLTENKYALRSLCPFAALFAATILTSKLKAKGQGMRLILLSIIFLSVMGSVVSMGRATVLFTMVLVSGILAWRGRIAPLVAFGAFGILAIAGIRIGYEANPEWIPVPVQRAVALIPGMQMSGGGATGSIESSSDWRYELFEMAIHDWKSTPRNFWFGRSTSAITGSDIAQFAISAFKSSVILDVSLNRGTTHNLVTDLLVNIGLVGATLMFLLWGSTIFLFFRIARGSAVESPERQIFMVAGIFSSFQLVYGVIGGATFPFQAVLIACLGLLLFRNNTIRPIPTITTRDR